MIPVILVLHSICTKNPIPVSDFRNWAAQIRNLVHGGLIGMHNGVHMLKCTHSTLPPSGLEPTGNGPIHPPKIDILQLTKVIIDDY